MRELNRFVTLERYVAGGALDETCFALRERPVVSLGKGQVLLQTLALSVDPYMRSRMTGLDNFYLPQYRLGEPIESLGVGRVVESDDPRYKAGDLVQGLIEWADFSLWTGAGKLEAGGVLQHIARDIGKISHALGVYGLNGLTALFGVIRVAQPRRGEIMLISGAAGGIGTIAGQIANILGARVIGLAGSDEKCGVLVKRLGFQAALNYRSASLVEDLRALAPDGPDIYFDNVGGALSQTVMWQMQRPGRVVECGQIATYDDDDGGWRVDIRPLHAKGLRWESFTTAHFHEFVPAALAQLAHWVRSGKITPLETEHHGLEAAPRAMLGLLRGDNIGKMVVTMVQKEVDGGRA
jgi:NADPH-dependent curcumin reductase CurA